MSEALKKVGSISELATKIIDSIFQLDRLDALSKKSMFVTMAHAELICLINYVILSQSTIKLQQIEVFGYVLAAKEFEPNLNGKLDALALCFSHVASKLDNMVGSEALSQVMQSMDWLGDIAKAAIPTTSTIKHVKS